MMAARKPKPINGIAKERKVKEAAYLTKRILVSASRKAFIEAAIETTAIVGYNTIAEDGWVVRAYPDGRREKVSKIKHVEHSTEIIFD